MIAIVAGTASSPSNQASAVVARPAGGLAVDTVVAADGNSAVTTPPFSTSAPGELLIAFVASDGPQPGSQSVTVSGAGLAWSLVKRMNAQAGTSEIWKASAASALTNVTVTSTPVSGGLAQSVTLVAFSGAAGVGASGVASAASGAPSVTIVSTQPGSLIYGVGNDWDNAVARTPGGGQAILRQVLASAGDTFWFQNRTSGSSGGGVALQLNDTSPTSDRWNLAAVEILPSAPLPTQVAVPNVVNLTQAAATSTLTSAQLTVGTVTTASSATIASGSVISESPASGTLLAPGSPVNLVVSSGPAQVAVPNVVNLTQANATSAITSARLVLGAVTSAQSATIAAGAVISESPSAGTLVAPGSRVDLLVSTGPPPRVTVPNVVNQSQANASASLTAAGLIVGTVDDGLERYGDGRIGNQPEPVGGCVRDTGFRGRPDDLDGASAPRTGD